MPDESNGRVTIAVLGSKLDSMIDAQLATNRRIDEIHRTQADVCQAIAVNNEKWLNHKDLHKRERSALGGLSAALSTAAAAFSVWWNGQ